MNLLIDVSFTSYWREIVGRSLIDQVKKIVQMGNGGEGRVVLAHEAHFDDAVKMRVSKRGAQQARGASVSAWEVREYVQK